jgi:hypothetical protein
VLLTVPNATTQSSPESKCIIDSLATNHLFWIIRAFIQQYIEKFNDVSRYSFCIINFFKYPTPSVFCPVLIEFLKVK